MLSLTKVAGAITTVDVVADRGSDTHILGIIGRGSAKCRSDDVFSDSVGETIALGRAIQDFGRQVEATGHARIVTREELSRVIELEFEFALAALGIK